MKSRIQVNQYLKEISFTNQHEQFVVTKYLLEKGMKMRNCSEVNANGITSQAFIEWCEEYQPERNDIVFIEGLNIIGIVRYVSGNNAVLGAYQEGEKLVLKEKEFLNKYVTLPKPRWMHKKQLADVNSIVYNFLDSSLIPHRK